MDEKNVEQGLLNLTEQVTQIDGELAALWTAVDVLRALLALQLFPDDPQQGVQLLEAIEKQISANDREAPRRRRVLEIIETLKVVQKHGPLPEA